MTRGGIGWHPRGATTGATRCAAHGPARHHHPHGPLYRETLAHHPGYTLVGVYDPDPERGAALLAREGVGVPVSGDIDAAIAASEADTVLVTLPNDVTPAAIITAAAHGLPILCEKPCARSAADFAPVLEVIGRSRAPFLPAYLRRASTVALAMRELIAGGSIGDVVAAHATHLAANAALRNATYLTGGAIEHVRDSGDPETRPQGHVRHWLFDRSRSGGGVTHWLDLLRMVSGAEVTRVSATLATRTAAPIGV